MFETEYGDARQLVSWALGLGDRARILGPPELVDEARRAARPRDRAPLDRRPTSPSRSAQGERDRGRRERRERGAASEADAKRETPIRPERFARLVTLAGILIEAARSGSKLDLKQVTDSLQITETELREDIDVLNVVNFGGGSYVLYAEVSGDEIEVDPEPYGDNFAKPARLLPLEAKALVAAIDLIGDHLPEGQLQSAREKIVDGARHRPGRRRPADHLGDRRRLADRARRVARRSTDAAPDRDRVLQGERGQSLTGAAGSSRTS